MVSKITYSHIRISRYETFHRYIAIQRYINIRSKSCHATIPLTSNKALHGHPSAMIFGVVSLYTAKLPFLRHAVKSR
jgi:hypothetical protein